MLPQNINRVFIIYECECADGYIFNCFSTKPEISADNFVINPYTMNNGNWLGFRKGDEDNHVNYPTEKELNDFINEKVSIFVRAAKEKCRKACK